MKPLFCLYIFFGLCCGYSNSSLYAQDRPGSLRFMYEFGFQEHERRIFRFYEVPQKSLGTYQLAVGITKGILWNETGRLSFLLNYGLEVNTFKRRFNHCLIPHHHPAGPGFPCNSILLHARRHFYHTLRPGVMLQVTLYQNSGSEFRVYLHGIAATAFQFRKSYWNTRQPGLNGIHGKWQVALFAVEASGGLGFSLDDLDFTFYYRMYNYRRVDRVLFNKRDEIPQDYEERNLFKVGVVMTTPLPKLKWLRKKKEGD